MKTLICGFFLIISVSCTKDKIARPLPSAIFGEWKFVRIFDKTQSISCWECPGFNFENADPGFILFDNDSTNITLQIENHQVRGHISGNLQSHDSMNSGGNLQIFFNNSIPGFFKDINELLSSDGKLLSEELTKVHSYNLPHHASTAKYSFMELISNQYLMVFSMKK